MSLIQALAATSATQTSALGIENPAMQQFTSIQDMFEPFGWSWPWEDDEKEVDTTTTTDTNDVAPVDTPDDTNTNEDITPAQSETQEPVADAASDSNISSGKETQDDVAIDAGSEDAVSQAEDQTSSKDEQPVDDASSPTDSTEDSTPDSGSTDEGSGEQEEKGDEDDGDKSDAKDPSWRPRDGDDFRTPNLDPNDDDDDDRRVPIDNNGPRDSFNSLVEDCGWQCQLTFSLQVIYFGVHLWLYAGELHAWAEANLILIFGTIWFLFMSVWTCGVGFMHPDFLAQPLWTRLAPFVLSVMYMAYYMTGIIFEMVKVFGTGETWKDSVHEIIIAYMLWINIPSALTMTTYIILEMVNTEDIIESPEEDKQEMDDQSDDDDDDGAYYDKYDDSKSDDKVDDDQPDDKADDKEDDKADEKDDPKPEDKSEN